MDNPWTEAIDFTEAKLALNEMILADTGLSIDEGQWLNEDGVHFGGRKPPTDLTVLGVLFLILFIMAFIGVAGYCIYKNKKKTEKFSFRLHK